MVEETTKTEKLPNLTYSKTLHEIKDKASASRLEKGGYVLSHFADGKAHFHNSETGKWDQVDASSRQAVIEVLHDGKEQELRK